MTIGRVCVCVCVRVCVSIYASVSLGNSLLEAPIGPMLDPEIFKYMNFYDRNVIYGPNGLNSAWLLKVAR